MSGLILQNITRAEARAFQGNESHGPFCTVEVQDDKGFNMSLFLGPDLSRAQLVAEAIKLAMAPITVPEVAI
jgi:hypothetical protein